MMPLAVIVLNSALGLLDPGLADAKPGPVPAPKTELAGTTTSAPQRKDDAQASKPAETVTVTPVPSVQLPRRVVRTPATIPGKPERWVKVPTSTTRIDVKRPYMRVWYWPPTPAGIEETPAVVGANTKTVAYSFGMILDPVNFAYNSAEVLPPATHLKHVATWLQADATHAVTLTGHADSRGSVGYNRKLSQRRAEAVKARLVELGAPTARILTRGLGVEKQLHSGSSTEDHWWASRRVEISLHPAEPRGAVAISPKVDQPTPSRSEGDDSTVVAETK